MQAAPLVFQSTRQLRDALAEVPSLRLLQARCDRQHDAYVFAIWMVVFGFIALVVLAILQVLPFVGAFLPLLALFGLSSRASEARHLSQHYGRCIDLHETVGELAPPLERLGLHRAVITVDTDELLDDKHVVRRRSEGDDEWRDYRLDRVRVRGRLGDYELELVQTDECHRWTHSGDPEYGGHWDEHKHHAAIHLRLAGSRHPDRRLSRLRQAMLHDDAVPCLLEHTEQEETRFRLVLRLPQKADLEQVIPALQWLDRFSSVIYGESEPARCPTCGRHLEGNHCRACRGQWVDRTHGGAHGWSPVPPLAGGPCPGCDHPLEAVPMGRTRVETCRDCEGFWIHAQK